MTQVSNEQLGNLLEQIREGAKNSVRDVFNAATDPAALIRDGATGSAYNGLGVEVVRGVCRAWGEGKHPLGGIPAVDGFYGSLCKPYLVSIGAWPGDGTLEVPFNGGQCPVVYEATLNGPPIPAGTGQMVMRGTGPISGICIFEVLPSGNYRLGLATASGCVREAASGQASVAPSVYDQWKITSLVRLDGQPDNCGNPPYDYTDAPGTPIDPGSDEPVTIPGPYGDFNVNVSFSNSGDIIICPIDQPNVPCVSIPGPSEPKGPQNPVNPGPHSPDDQGEPGTPQVTGDGGAVDGEAPEGQVLVGVRLELVAAVSPARPDPTPNGTFYRGAVYVYMGADGGLDLQPEGSIVKFPQFFFAPETSTKWSVVANLGYSVRVIPYYRQVDS